MAATAPAASAPAGEPTPAEVAALVKQLGDDRFQTRQAAQKELIRLACPEVYGQVQQAARSPDPEVAQRASDILQAMGPQAAAWAGRKIRQGLLWQRELKGGLCWPVAVAGGVVCLRGPDGTVRGLDARTGKDLWAAPDAAAMAVDGKSVFLIDTDRKLVALDLASGKPVAGFRPQGNAGFVRLAAAGGTVYASRIDVTIPVLAPASAPAGAKDAQGAKEPPGPRAASALLALDGATGKCKWQYSLGQILAQDPIVADGMVYAVSGGRATALGRLSARRGQTEGGAVFGGEIVALDASGGGRKWSFVDPSGDGGGVLRCLGAGDNKVCVSTGYWTTGLDAAVGKLLWRNGGRSHDGTWGALPEPAHWADGVVYAVSGGMFSACDMARGTVRWTYRPELTEKGPVTAGADGTITINAGGTIVLNGGTLTVTVGPNGGGVAILNGKVVGTGDPPAAGLSLPTPLNGTIFFTSPQGLQAVRVLDWTVQWRLSEKGLLPYRPILANGVLYFASRPPGGPPGPQGPVILYALKLP
jgi:outer membrane protein assembly factor BamB